MSGFRCQFCKGSLTKVHYPKLYNMTHLLSLNVLLLPKDLTIIFYLHGHNLTLSFCSGSLHLGSSSVLVVNLYLVNESSRTNKQFMINIPMNQKRGLTDLVSCPTMEIHGRRITYNSGAKEKHQLDPGGPINRQEAPAPMKHMRNNNKFKLRLCVSLCMLMVFADILQLLKCR